jgi:hypothetical protein
VPMVQLRVGNVHSLRVGRAGTAVQYLLRIRIADERRIEEGRLKAASFGTGRRLVIAKFTAANDHSNRDWVEILGVRSIVLRSRKRSPFSWRLHYRFGQCQSLTAPATVPNAYHGPRQGSGCPLRINSRRLNRSRAPTRTRPCHRRERVLSRRTQWPTIPPPPLGGDTRSRFPVLERLESLFETPVPQ